jgi:hypothetical protein
MLFQGVTFISFFFGLQRMGEHYPLWAHGGTAWFTDLAHVDPTHILPALCSLSFLGTVEAAPKDSTNPMSARMSFAFRFLALSMLPISMTMPSGVLLYWVTSNTVGTLQGLALRSPRIRTAWNLPPLPVPGAYAATHSNSSSMIDSKHKGIGHTDDVRAMDQSRSYKSDTHFHSNSATDGRTQQEQGEIEFVSYVYVCMYVYMYVCTRVSVYVRMHTRRALATETR